MGIKKAYLLFVLFLVNVVLVSAEFEMRITFDRGDYDIRNKSISLKNTLTDFEVFKVIDGEGVVKFDIKELVDNFYDLTPIVSTICLQNTSECRGYFFYFPLSERYGKHLNVFLHGAYIEYVPLNSSYYPSASCSDTNLIICSQTIFDERGKIIYHAQVYNKSNFVQLPQSSGAEGFYFFEIYASNGVNSVLEINPFFQKSIKLKNPYNYPSKAIINLTNTSCYFEDGIQVETTNLKPNESKVKSVYCTKEEDLKKETNVTFNLIIFDFVNFILTLLLTIIGSGLFYLFSNPTSTKKKSIKKIVLLSFVFYILVYILLMLLKYYF